MTFNVLIPAMAATSILGCNKTFKFLKWLSNSVDEMGRDVPLFAAPQTLTGSIQAVPNKMYEQLGLDLNHNYKTVFCPELMQSIAEKIQPDRIEYENRTFELVENKNWYETNGYIKALIVELKELRKNESKNNQIQE